MHFRKLNRWERLWVVLGFVYGVAVAIIALWNLPQHLTINERLGDGGVFDGDIVPTKTYWFVRFESGWGIVEAVAQNPTTKEYLYQRNGRWSKPLASLPYMKVSPGSDEASLELRVKQAGFLGLSLLGWLVSWTLVYLVGVAVEVMIGSMKKRHNQTRRVAPVFVRRSEWAVDSST
jgi:hypothetical protein